jgi:hypothetical protein
MGETVFSQDATAAQHMAQCTNHRPIWVGIAPLRVERERVWRIEFTIDAT